MKAIVLKDSTFNRVTARLRAHGSDVYFSSLPSRFSHDLGFTYLYFRSFLDLPNLPLLNHHLYLFIAFLFSSIDSIGDFCPQSTAFSPF